MVTRKRRGRVEPSRDLFFRSPIATEEPGASRKRPRSFLQPAKGLTQRNSCGRKGFVALGLLVTAYSALGPLSRKVYKAGTPGAARVERVRPAGEPGLPREEAEETVGRVSRLRARALSTCSSLPFSQYRTEVTASRSARSAPRAGARRARGETESIARGESYSANKSALRGKTRDARHCT